MNASTQSSIAASPASSSNEAILGSRPQTAPFTADALGFLELSSISRGLFLTDALLKKAPTQVLFSQPVSSGKHIILFVGDVASVEESYQEAVNHAAGTLVRNILIPWVHESLRPFLNFQDHRLSSSDHSDESFGIAESMTLAGAIIAADRAAKTAAVRILRLRLGQGIGGKAYFVFSGKQDEVEASLEAASLCLQELESLVRVDMVARPINEVLEYF